MKITAKEDVAFYQSNPQLSEKVPLGSKISQWLDCVGAEAAQSIAASRENYDVEVRCVSGVRYITSDPIGLLGGMNTFGYAYQNSLNYFDPNGEAVQVLIGGGLLLGYIVCYAAGPCNPNSQPIAWENDDPTLPPGWKPDWPTPTWPDGDEPEWVDPNDLILTIPVPGGPNCPPDDPNEDCEEQRKLGSAICKGLPSSARSICYIGVAGDYITCVFKDIFNSWNDDGGDFFL